MHCPKCGAQISDFSILCPKCHERIPGRQLHEVAKYSLHESKTKGQEENEQESHGQHSWLNVLIGFFLLCAVILFCFRISGPLMVKIRGSASEAITISQENLEEVCRQGFRQLSSSQDINYDRFEEEVDRYAQAHGLVNSEMFFTMCGQFAGELAEEVFKHYHEKLP